MSPGCFIYGSQDGRSWRTHSAGRMPDCSTVEVCVCGCTHVYLYGHFCVEPMSHGCSGQDRRRHTVCTVGSIAGADRETRRSMSCDHEVEAAYDH